MQTDELTPMESLMATVRRRERPSGLFMGSQDIFGDIIVVFSACRALIMVSVCRQMTCGVDMLWMGLFMLGHTLRADPEVWTTELCLCDEL